MTTIHDAINRLRAIAPEARDEYGDIAQLIKATEECGELITAIARRQNGGRDMDAILDEAADVLIMAYQAGVIVADEEALAARIVAKAQRLRDRMEDGR